MATSSSSVRKPFEFLVTASQKQRCRDLAAQEAVSMSEIVRRAVAQYAESQTFERELQAFVATASLHSQKGPGA